MIARRALELAVAAALLAACSPSAPTHPPGTPAVVTDLRAIQSRLVADIWYEPPDMMEGLTVGVELSVRLSDAEAVAFYCSTIAPVIHPHLPIEGFTLFVWSNGADEIQASNDTRCGVAPVPMDGELVA